MNVSERWRAALFHRSGAVTIDSIILTLSRISLIVLGIIGISFALHAGKVLLSPIVFAVVIGLMLGPTTDRLERTGLPSALSSFVVVVVLVTVIGAVGYFVVMPLSEWSRYLPLIWIKIQAVIADWKDVLTSIESLRETLQSAAGDTGKMEVKIDDGSPVVEAAWLAPTIFMQIIIFIASLFLFLETRHQIRLAVLSLCFERKLRWRVAHVFRDVEVLVSTYLLSITGINIGLGIVVAVAMAIAGIPSAILWGILAGLLNYAVYIGPAVMAVILLCVGLATGTTTAAYFLPAGIYLLINLLESQFITPRVLGRTLTLNPFVVFLAIGYWLWLWGPVGGFLAVPMLLIIVAIIRHVIPENHRMIARQKNAAEQAGA